jgi:outer membrane protein assembly factor BamB
MINLLAMKRTLLLQLMILILFVSVNYAQQNNKDWPHPDGNSERTAFVNTDMAPPFKYTSIDIGVDSECFSYADNVVYMAYKNANNDHIFGAFDMNSQSALWDYKIKESGGGIGFCPTISDDLVYVGGQRGPGILALDRMSGDSVWLHPSQSQYGRHVAVYGDRLFAHPSSSNGAGLVVMNKNTGEVEWDFGTSGAQTVPLVDEDHVYYTTRINDTIYAFTHSGEIVWKHETVAEIDDFEATMSKGDTFFIKTRRELSALNRFTGEEFWTTLLPDTFSFISTLNALSWSPHGLISHEWIGDWRDSFKIRSFDLKTGQINWTKDLNPRSGTPCTTFGDYLVNINGGNLEIRDARTGNVLQEITNTNLDDYTRIVVTDGQILASQRNNILIFTPIPSSIDNGIKNDWQILNNPVGDLLYLTYSGDDQLVNVPYHVLNMKGQETASLGTLTFEKGKQSIRLSQLPAGNYLLVMGENGRYGSEVFIKQ